MTKKLFIFITLFFLLATDVSGVNRTDTLPLADSSAAGLMYKKKAKTALVTGVILSSAGVLAAGIGMGLTLSGLSHLFEPGYQSKDYGSLPSILGYGGLTLIAASVPLFIVSGKYKRKAKLYLRYQKPDLPHAGKEIKGQMSAGVVINF
jgi:hypothetical protein